VAGLSDEFSSSVDMAGQGRFNTWEAGLFFEWPIPNRTARGNYRAAVFEHQRAKVQLRSVVEQITRDVADALSDLQTSEAKIASAKEAHDLNERLLQAEEKSFSLGRSNSVDVLIAQENAASAERDEVQAHTDYATALANLLSVQGTLDRK
jgi:outer membrane protein TolC